MLPARWLPLVTSVRAAFSYLLGGQPVQRGSGDVEHRQINVDLSAMMDFVLYHRTQPFPNRDGSTFRGRTFAIEFIVAEARDDLETFS